MPLILVAGLAQPAVNADVVVPTLVLGVSPSSAERGDLVTVSGVGFIQPEVTIGDLPAPIVSLTLTEIVVSVPEVPAGPTNLQVRTLATSWHSTPFAVYEGTLLQGDPDANAIASLVDDPPLAVLASEIEPDGLLLTRLEGVIHPSATVGQVNDALESAGATITSSSVGLPVVSLAIPRQSGFEAMQVLAHELNDAPSFMLVSPARRPRPSELPGSPADADVGHLRASRFPAAWNASDLLIGCQQAPVEVIVADGFGRTPPVGFFGEVPQSQFTYVNAKGANAPQDDHGWQVTAALAADLDTVTPTGANPNPGCLRVTAIEAGNITSTENLNMINAAIRASTRPIVNTSLGETPDDATAENVEQLYDPVDLARLAIHWQFATRDLTESFLHTTTTGNAEADQINAAYRGISGTFNSVWSFAAFGGSLNFPGQSYLWRSTLAEWPDLTASAQEMAELTIMREALGLPEVVPPRGNTLAVGSSTPNGGPSNFSLTPHTVTAVGEDVSTFGGAQVDGTSFASPTVAGLASWLWLLSPDLRSASPSETATLIRETATGSQTRIDAFAATLALDDPALGLGGASIRRAMADVDASGQFDHLDVEALKDTVTGVNLGLATNLRGDLNGSDRAGTGDIPARADIDNGSSTRFRGGTLTALPVDVDGAARNVNEADATDTDVLCAWAFSSLYQGTAAERWKAVRWVLRPDDGECHPRRSSDPCRTNP